MLALMEDMDETEEATEVAVPALDILNDFIDGFVKKDERINAPLYIRIYIDKMLHTSTSKI